MARAEQRKLDFSLRRIAPGLLCLALPMLVLCPAPAAQPGVKAEFIGGTLAAPLKSSVRVDLTSAEALVLRLDKSEIRVPYRKINTLEYGQKVSRRYAEAIVISPLLLLARSRKHYVTLGYQDERQAQQALVLRVGKGDIRAVLAGLEARTGRRVEYQDDQARKGGSE
jgi:hypothetical protein